VGCRGLEGFRSILTLGAFWRSKDDGINVLSIFFVENGFTFAGRGETGRESCRKVRIMMKTAVMNL
jgi:hypothetical protein